MCPKLYLISRKLTAEQIEEIKRQLSLTPLAAVVTPDIRDSQIANEFGTATPLASPIAILADFEEPLTAVNEDGSLCPVR